MRIKRIVVNKDLPLRDDEGGIWKIHDLRDEEYIFTTEESKILQDWKGNVPTYLYVNTNEQAYFYISLLQSRMVDVMFGNEYLSITVPYDISKTDFEEMILENEREHKEYVKNRKHKEQN